MWVVDVRRADRITFLAGSWESLHSFIVFLMVGVIFKTLRIYPYDRKSVDANV
jgi:hypothetical protein